MELRQHERVPVQLPCQVAVPEGVCVSHALNISQTGLAFDATDFTTYPHAMQRLEQLLPHDRLVHLELVLPTGELFVASGHVRWIGNGAICGVEFATLRPEMRSVLDGFILERLPGRDASLPGTPAR